MARLNYPSTDSKGPFILQVVWSLLDNVVDDNKAAAYWFPSTMQGFSQCWFPSIMKGFSQFSEW